MSSCLLVEFFLFCLFPFSPFAPPSALPASSLPSLAAQLYLLPCPYSSIHPAALLILVSSTSLRRVQYSQPGCCLHPPGTTPSLSLSLSLSLSPSPSPVPRSSLESSSVSLLLGCCSLPFTLKPC